MTATTYPAALRVKHGAGCSVDLISASLTATLGGRCDLDPPLYTETEAWIK